MPGFDKPKRSLVRVPMSKRVNRGNLNRLNVSDAARTLTQMKGK